jgi:hypothetical protein
MMGGGDIQMVGTGGIVAGSLFVTVLGSRFAVLGSGIWKRQKLRETG